MVNVLLGSQAPQALIEALERGQSVFDVIAISKTLQSGSVAFVFLGRIEGSGCVVKSYQKSKLTDGELCQVRGGLCLENRPDDAATVLFLFLVVGRAGSAASKRLGRL
jgi:hypothetical protein